MILHSVMIQYKPQRRSVDPKVLHEPYSSAMMIDDTHCEPCAD